MNIKKTIHKTIALAVFFLITPIIVYAQQTCEFIPNDVSSTSEEISAIASNEEPQSNEVVEAANDASSGVVSIKSNLIGFNHFPDMPLEFSDTQLFGVVIFYEDFPKPAGGYKTKVYIKPVSKKDENTHMVFGPFSEVDKLFSWSEATAGGYVDSNGNKVATTGADYDLNFPQQYFFRVVTYDGSTEKDNITATIDTTNAETTAVEESVNNGNSFLKISATPKLIKQGEPVSVTIEAINSPDPAKQIKKVVLYACISSNDCAVKKSWENISFDNNGNAKLTTTWETSGSSIGEHTLMAKAFNAESAGGDGYIDGSKTEVMIKITNSTVGSATGTGSAEARARLIRLEALTPASKNDTGSTIGSVESLVNRVIDIILILIGAFATISIIVGGIFYITSGGDQAKAEKGKKTIIYAIFGIVIATLGFVIEVAVLDIVKRLLG